MVLRGCRLMLAQSLVIAGASRKILCISDGLASSADDRGNRGQGGVERVEGIEPSTKAWEAFVLPLNYTRVCAALFTRTLNELEAQVIKKLVGTP